MPNWCSNAIAIRAANKESSSDLLKLYLQMSIATSKYRKCKIENSWDERWIGNLFYEAGHTDKRDLDGINCRGEVCGLELKDVPNPKFKGEKYIELLCESAWSPCADDIMGYIIDEQRLNLYVDYVAEEPGSGIYINTDTKGEIFKDRYLIEYSIDGDDDRIYVAMDEDYKPIQKLINRLTGIKIRDLGDLKVWHEEIIDGFHKTNPGDDYYLNIEIFNES